VKCDVELLSALVDGDLSARKAARVRAHLTGCASCGGALADLETMKRGLGALPDGMPRQFGDVVVCPHVAGEEWRRPLVHALLHLVGYDHGPEMEAREAVYAS